MQKTIIVIFWLLIKISQQMQHAMITPSFLPLRQNIDNNIEKRPPLRPILGPIHVGSQAIKAGVIRNQHILKHQQVLFNHKPTIDHAHVHRKPIINRHDNFQVPVINRHGNFQVARMGALNNFNFTRDNHPLRIKFDGKVQIQQHVDNRLELRLKEKAQELYVKKFQRYVDINNNVWSGAIKQSRAYSFFVKMFYNIQNVLTKSSDKTNYNLLNLLTIFEDNYQKYISKLKLVDDYEFDLKLLNSQYSEYIRSEFKLYFNLLQSMKNMRTFSDQSFLIDLNRLIVEFEIDTIIKSNYIFQLAMVVKVQYAKKQIDNTTSFDKLMKDFTYKMNLFKSEETVLIQKVKYSIVAQFFIKFYQLFVVNIKSIKISQDFLQQLVHLGTTGEKLLENSTIEKKEKDGHSQFYYKFQKADYLNFQYMVITIRKSLADSQDKFYYKSFVQILFNTMTLDLRQKFTQDGQFIIEKIEFGDIKINDIKEVTFDDKMIVEINTLIKQIRIKNSLILDQVWLIINYIYGKRQFFMSSHIVVSTWLQITRYYIIILKYLKNNANLNQQNQKIIYKKNDIDKLKSAIDDLYYMIYSINLNDQKQKIVILKQVNILIQQLKSLNNLKIQTSHSEEFVYEDVEKDGNQILSLNKDQQNLKRYTKKIDQTQITYIQTDNWILIQFMQQFGVLQIFKNVKWLYRLYEIIIIYKLKFLEQQQEYQSLGIELIIQQILILMIQIIMKVQIVDSKMKIDRHLILLIFQTSKLDQNFSKFGELYVKFKDFSKDLENTFDQEQNQDFMLLDLLEQEEDFDEQLKQVQKTLKNKLKEIQLKVSKDVQSKLQFDDDDDQKQLAEGNKNSETKRPSKDELDSKSKEDQAIQNKLEKDNINRAQKVQVRKIYVIEYLDCEDCLSRLNQS